MDLNVGLSAIYLFPWTWSSFRPVKESLLPSFLFRGQILGPCKETRELLGRPVLPHIPAGLLPSAFDQFKSDVGGVCLSRGSGPDFVPFGFWKTTSWTIHWILARICCRRSPSHEGCAHLHLWRQLRLCRNLWKQTFRLALTPSKNGRLLSFTLFLERSVLILSFSCFLTTSTSLRAKGAFFLCKCIGDAFRCTCDGLKAEKRPWTRCVVPSQVQLHQITTFCSSQSSSRSSSNYIYRPMFYTNRKTSSHPVVQALRVEPTTCSFWSYSSWVFQPMQPSFSICSCACLEMSPFSAHLLSTALIPSSFILVHILETPLSTKICRVFISSASFYVLSSQSRQTKVFFSLCVLAGNESASIGGQRASWLIRILQKGKELLRFGEWVWNTGWRGLHSGQKFTLWTICSLQKEHTVWFFTGISAKRRFAGVLLHRAGGYSPKTAP